MSTVSQIGAAETAKYLMDIPSCVIPQDTDSFDSVYSDISTGDEDLDTIFEEVSKEYGVNVNLLKAVHRQSREFDSSGGIKCRRDGDYAADAGNSRVARC